MMVVVNSGRLAQAAVQIAVSEYLPLETRMPVSSRVTADRCSRETQHSGSDFPSQEHLGSRLVLASLGIVIGDRLDGDPLADLVLKQLQLGFDPLAILLLESCVFQPLLKAIDCRQSHCGRLGCCLAGVFSSQQAMLQPILAIRHVHDAEPVGRIGEWCLPSGPACPPRRHRDSDGRSRRALGPIPM